MTVRRRILALGIAGGVALAAPAAAHAATKVVNMGLPVSAQKQFNQRLGADVNDFFPHGVTINVGDSVRFVPTGFHTVDLVPRGAGPLPLFTPQGTVSGALDAAGAPFWFNGQPGLGFNPALIASSLGKRVTFDGSARVDTGLPLAPHPKPMTVTFRRAGRYTYDCDVHPGMKGVVRVKPKGAAVPSARRDKRALARQLARDLSVAKALRQTRPPGNTVDVGAAGPYGVEFFAMVPQSIAVPAGTTLRFRMTPKSFEDHTATFGPGDPETQPTSYLGTLAASLESPQLNPAAVYPSEPPGTIAALSPALHGNGFWNSGAMDTSAATPLPLSASVTFDTPGTYQFYCLIHPFMHGTVVVR